MIHSYSNIAEEEGHLIGFFFSHWLFKYLVIKFLSSNPYYCVEIKILIFKKYISVFSKIQDRQHDLYKRILDSTLWPCMAQGDFGNGLLLTE